MRVFNFGKFAALGWLILFAVLSTGGRVFAAEAEPAPELRFSTRVEGAKIPDDLRGKLESSIQLGKGSAPAPPTLGQLRVRAQEDAERLDTVLRSEAYYNGEVYPVIQEEAGGNFDVIFRVTLGSRTMIRNFDILYTDNPVDEATLPQDAAKLGLKPNRSVRAQRVIDLTSQAMTYLQNHGHPRPELEDRKVIVDLAAHQADISLRIKAGAPKRFGPLVIRNDGRTKNSYVQSLAAFKPGEIYDRRKADKTVASLRKTGLFDQVSIEAGVPEADEAETGTEPQVLTLEERPARSIGVGANWSSSDGAGVRGLWEHRNLFGRAEKLNLTAVMSQLQQSFTADFNRPRFLRDDQNLLANLEVARENTDAYDEQRVQIGAGLSREFGEHMQASAGGSFQLSRTEDNNGNHSYRLFGLPLTFRYDGSNDLLDPTEGQRAGLSLTPYGGTADGSPATFLRFEATGSAYMKLAKKLTLAFRGRYGSILTKDTFDVPGSLRFYAGGGGSIRGYAYQEAGPLDEDGDPRGGRSAVEMNAEARYRINKQFGLVAFIDGGNAYESITPKFNRALLWGAGVGVRYYTPIGPVRADIAMPLNRRHGVDSAVQLYFSLGQAF